MVIVPSAFAFMGLAAHSILLDRTEWNSSLSPNRHCLIRLFLPSKSFRPFRSPSRRAGGSLRSLLTVNGEGMPASTRRQEDQRFRPWPSDDDEPPPPRLPPDGAPRDPPPPL